MRRTVGQVLSVLLIAVVVVVVALAIALIGTAGIFLTGRVVGGLFGVGTFEATIVALAVAVALGLVIWRLIEKSTSAMVPRGSEDPQELEYDGEGATYCPNCDQRLTVPQRRPDRRQR